jgi:hypothetical protein
LQALLFKTAIQSKEESIIEPMMATNGVFYFMSRIILGVMPAHEGIWGLPFCEITPLLTL